MVNNIIVYEPSRNIRTLGRRALEGNWGIAIGGVLLYSLLIIIPTFILSRVFGSSGSGYDAYYYDIVYGYVDYDYMMQQFSNSLIGNIYTWLVTGPLMLGLIIFIGSIFRRRGARISDLFAGFEHFVKALGLYIVMNIFIFLWSLLLVIPGIIAAYRYLMAFYILMDHPEMGIMEAMRASKFMMQNNKWKLFCLQISFIGWAILSLFTLGLGFIVLSPYIEMSTFAFYELANGNLVIRHEREAIPGSGGQADPGRFTSPGAQSSQEYTSGNGAESYTPFTSQTEAQSTAETQSTEEAPSTTAEMQDGLRTSAQTDCDEPIPGETEDLADMIRRNLNGNEHEPPKNGNN